MDDDFEIDDILNNQLKKKKKNSGRKGKRGERSLIEELTERFPNKPFSRTIGSGNRWSQARLTEAAKKVFTGDIVTPDNFLFALECKHGYNKINIERAIKKGNKKLDSFLEQVEKDGERVNKNPMMCWKKDYKPWIVFIKTSLIPESIENIQYKNWGIVSLERLLELPDSFFFKGENDG